MVAMVQTSRAASGDHRSRSRSRYGQAIDVIDVGIEPDAEPRQARAARERGAHAEDGADAADDQPSSMKMRIRTPASRRRAP